MKKREKIEKKVKELNIDTFGVANLELLKEHKTNPENLTDNYKRGISIGLKLSDEVFDNLPESRPLYADHYRIANQKLNQAAYEISTYIEKQGYKSMPIHTSKVLNKKNWSSYLSHKAIARAAGIGWIGKSLLLISEKYGPRIRLASILTDMPLNSDKPIENKCGKCTKCIKSCIANSLNDTNFKNFPSDDRTNFEIEKCVEKINEFDQNPNIGEKVCGICIKACPVGK